MLLCFFKDVSGSESQRRGYCLQSTDAQQVATNFFQLATNYSDALADNTMAPDYTQYSTSMHALTDVCTAESVQHPSLAPLFNNRRAFKAAQFAQSGLAYQQLNMWHSCDTVIVRYQLESVTGSVEDIVGMASISTQPAPIGKQYAHWITTVYDEFDLRRWCKAIHAQISDAGGP